MIAVFLAAYLHAPPGLVATVYDFAGLDGVAVVWMESRFVETAQRREPRGHTSYGLWQLDSEWFNQYRDDLLLHLVTGAAFLAECKARSTTLAGAVTRYNGSAEWGRKVEKKRDELARWLQWREVKAMETAR